VCRGSSKKIVSAKILGIKSNNFPVASQFDRIIWTPLQLHICNCKTIFEDSRMKSKNTSMKCSHSHKALAGFYGTHSRRLFHIHKGF
jgi:hypothetical protein